MKTNQIQRTEELYQDFIDIPSLFDEIVHAQSNNVPNYKLNALLHNYICAAAAESNGTEDDDNDVIMAIDDAFSGMDHNLEDEPVQINHNVVDCNGVPYLEVSILVDGVEVVSAKYSVREARVMHLKRKIALGK